MAIRRVEALEISEFLGSLLASVIDAQAQSARATVAFIDDIGFEDTAEGNRLRMVTMRYQKRDENDQIAEFEVAVPLLALVNVPSLAVKEAKLSFSYDVVSAVSVPDSSGDTPGIGIKSHPAIVKGVARKKTAPDAGSGKMTAAIDLDVTLSQQEIPIGVERLFDLAELGITEDKVEEG
jgi:hypothetical protein